MRKFQVWNLTDPCWEAQHHWRKKIPWLQVGFSCDQNKKPLQPCKEWPLRRGWCNSCRNGQHFQLKRDQRMALKACIYFWLALAKRYFNVLEMPRCTVAPHWRCWATVLPLAPIGSLDVMWWTNGSSNHLPQNIFYGFFQRWKCEISWICETFHLAQ